MRRFGRIQGLVLALGLPSFYHDVARNWGGIGFLYLMLLFTLTWIPVLAKWQISFGHIVQEKFPEALKDVPEINLQGGKVNSPVEQPLTIVDPQTGQPIFILDTTGEITSLDKIQGEVVMLLTDTKLHIRNHNKLEIHDLTQFPNMAISKAKIEEWGGWP